MERNSKLKTQNSKLSPQVRLEDIAVVADTPWKDAARPFEGDEIVAARPIPQPKPAEIGRCGPRQDLLFLRIQGSGRSAIEIPGSRLDLDKYCFAAVPHDEVELTTGAAPVAVARAIALDHEQEQGGPLGTAAETVGLWFGH